MAPYSGITDKKVIARVDDCVKQVMAKGRDKSTAIAICRAAIEGAHEAKEARFAANADLALLSISSPSAPARTYFDAEQQEKLKALANTIRNVLEAKIHQSFTVAADELFMRGYLTRDERIALSGVIGKILGEYGPQFDELTRDAPGLLPADIEGIAEKALGNARWNWTAGAGQSILGNLGRNTSGQFAPLAASGSTSANPAPRKTTATPSTSSSAGASTSSGTTSSGSSSGSRWRPYTQNAATTEGEPGEMRWDNPGSNPKLSLRDLAREWRERYWDRIRRALAATRWSKRPLEVPEGLQVLFESKELGGYIEHAEETTYAEPESAAPMVVFKDARCGKYRWVAVSSTAYRDRDKEIVSIQALKNDVDRADADGKYGPLRWWHVGKPDPWSDEPWGPGIDIGDCDFNMVIGKSLVESGTFRSDEVAVRFMEVADDLGLSIGFHHPLSQPDKSGVYSEIRRFERSALPRRYAANPWTAFRVETRKEKVMPSLSEKIKQLVGVLGGGPDAERIARTVLGGALDTEKAADAAGVEFKAAETQVETSAPQESQAPADAAQAGARDTSQAEPTQYEYNPDGGDDSVPISPEDIATFDAPAPEAETPAEGESSKEKADPTVGGGVVRSKLSNSDFVLPGRKFPVVKPGDVSDAVSSWGRYKGSISFDEFKSRLMALCRRKGEAFVNALPKDWKGGGEGKKETDAPAPQADATVVAPPAEETKAKAEDKPKAETEEKTEPKSEAKDEPKSEGQGDKEIRMGDLTVKEAGQLIAAIVMEAMTPLAGAIMGSAKEYEAAIAKMKEDVAQIATAKQAQDAEQNAEREAQAAKVKELEAKIAEAAESQKVLAAALAQSALQQEALTAELKELQGDVPAAVKAAQGGYVASEATDNLVGDNHRLKGKEYQPHADPIGDFFSRFPGMGGATEGFGPAGQAGPPPPQVPGR